MQDRLTAELREPLRRALELLAPLFPEIHSAWRGALTRLPLAVDECAALARLFDRRGRHLAGGDLEAFLLDLERQGQALGSRGVPEQHALRALALYLEQCLPHLVEHAPGRSELVVALVRLVSDGQASLCSGYAWARERDDGPRRARERQRLACDLHDQFGSLAILKLDLERAAGHLKQGRTRQAGRRVGEAQALLAETIASVRRVILDLAPSVIDEVGLQQAIRRAALQFSARTGIKVRLRGSAVPVRLPPTHQAALYRVLQGALSNVLRHSGAGSAAVTLAAAPGPAMVMSIRDDGVGFPPRGRAARLSFGLAAMRERTEALGGRFRVESWPARAGKRSRGTRIEVSLPVPPGSRT